LPGIYKQLEYEGLMYLIISAILSTALLAALAGWLFWKVPTHEKNKGNVRNRNNINCSHDPFEPLPDAAVLADLATTIQSAGHLNLQQKQACLINHTESLGKHNSMKHRRENMARIQGSGVLCSFQRATPPLLHCVDVLWFFQSVTSTLL
jgi:hypothetical protein